MRKITLLFIAFFLVSAISIAQQKKYISYEIKKGETLKSIAKSYNLSTKGLSKLNPGVSRKPVIGTIIIVPNKNFGKATTVVQPSSRNHIVKPKETLFGISKQYGITIDELKVVNPNLNEGLKIGMVLNIPKQTITQAKDSVNFVLHTVIKDDTVFNLTKRYNVSEDELYALNPILKDGLKLGMLLKIKPLELIEEEIIITSDSLTVFNENLNTSKTLNVAVILPYQMTKLNDSIIELNFEKRNSLLNIATEFHMGAQMAIDSLKEKGLDIDVQYFDSENSNLKLQRILSNQQNFSNTDIVIGPLFFEKAHWLAKRTDAKVIAPLYSKKQATLNSKNLIKSATNKNAHQDKLMTHLEANYKGENILVINDGLASTQSQLWNIVNKLKSFDSIQTISVIKPQKGYIDREKFYQNLDSIGKNWVVLISDESVTTSTTVNNLKGFSERIDINLFSFSKGKNFDNLDNSFLGALNFTFASSEYLNPEDLLVTNFYKKYKDVNRVYPSKYAIRGFDVTYDILIRMGSYIDPDNEFDFGKSKQLSSIFEYTKNDFGSIENDGLYLIQYNEDLSVTIFE